MPSMSWSLQMKADKLNFLIPLLQFLNKDEYLKGIKIYESVVKAYTTYVEPTKDEASRAEL